MEFIVSLDATMVAVEVCGDKKLLHSFDDPEIRTQEQSHTNALLVKPRASGKHLMNT